MSGAGRLAIATDFMDPTWPWPLSRQWLAGQLEQLRRGQVAVSFAAGLQQGLVDAGPQADLRGRFDPQTGSESISPIASAVVGGEERRKAALNCWPAGLAPRPAFPHASVRRHWAMLAGCDDNHPGP